MRVIGGQFRSRPLLAPSGQATRPTSDRLRETLMNVLENGARNRVAGARVLDLFAGTGAVGVEALSRGATSVTFVEQSAQTMAILESNCSNMGIGRQAHRVRAKAAQWLQRAASGELYDWVYLDPPWDDADAYTQTLEALGFTACSLLANDAWVIAEHRRKSALQDCYGCLKRWRILDQGDAALSFYACAKISAATHAEGDEPH